MVYSGTKIKAKPRVALISPQVIGAKKQVRRVQPPLGLACIAAVLENKGHNEIMIIDAAAEDYNNIMHLDDDPTLIKFGMSDEAVVETLRKFEPDIVGISSLFSSQIECVFSIARSLKKVLSNVPIILGGIHASNMYQDIMAQEKSVDFIIGGEGDYAFAEFAERYFSNEDYRNTPGLIWRNSTKIQKNISTALIRNMDELPFPAWHLMNMENYFSIGMPHNPFVKSGRVGCIMTSRGCPQNCYFCSSSDYFGHAFRAMSGSRVVEMINYMVDRFEIKELQIEDDNFTINYNRVIDICEGIKKLNLRITLPNAIRADMPPNHEKRLKMFQAMRNAGCEQIAISVEHGDQEFLNKVVGKKLDLNEVLATCDLVHKAGLLIHANFMMGFPFENAMQRKRTIEFARKLDADSFSVSLATPLPGTVMWDIVERNGLFMENFKPDRILYSQVSIKPYDISPEGLYKLVENLNCELNEAAQNKRPENVEKYKLFKGKISEDDRKYHHIIGKE